MKLLILSCNTGQGHNAASCAVAEEWERWGHTCEMVDALSLVSPALSERVKHVHTWLYCRAPGVWDWSYGYAERHPGLMGERGPAVHMLSRGMRALEEMLRQGRYDGVLCTHVFAGLLLSQVIKQQPLACYTAFLATDYSCCPGVSELALDAVVIPDGELVPEFVRAGVPVNRLRPLGIPVASRIRQRISREEAKIREKIDPQNGHALMMCGSMGCGPMEQLAAEMIRCMPEQTELTVVCGRNAQLRRTMEHRFAQQPGVHIRGYVENVSQLMDSADVFLTKPGGISTTEAAVKALPMVLVDAVAGCESGNCRFFVERGGAVTAETPAELAEQCCALLRDRERRRSMTRALEALEYGSAAERIVDMLSAGKNMEICG